MCSKVEIGHCINNNDYKIIRFVEQEASTLEESHCGAAGYGSWLVSLEHFTTTL